jgi:signal transduction histidine kinase
MCEFLLLRSPLILALLFGAAALLVSSLSSRLGPKSRQLRKALQERFNARMEERERIARELHDSLFQGLQGLMFRLQAVRQLLPECPHEAIAMLDAALERGDRVILESRMAVRDLRESARGREGLAELLTALGEEFAPGCCESKPSYHVLVAGTPLALEPAIHDEVYRIAREAIRNAFRHARPSRIEVEVTFEKTHLSVLIRDDGIGIDAQTLAQGWREGHWGLPGMRERALGFGGKIEVWSARGAGTEVELQVPNKLAYHHDASQLPLLMHIHELIHRHHGVVEVRHDDHRPKDDERDHEDSEGERQNVVG